MGSMQNTFRRYSRNSTARMRLRKQEGVERCSAEGHVSHVLSARMSSRPMGWSRKGVDRMAHLRAYYWNGRDMLEQIKRDIYLNRLIDRRENGMIKVVTGIRRWGKPYLLFKLYYQYLLDSGVDASRILRIPLDDDDYEELRNSKKLSAYIKEQISDGGVWYVFLDEVQMCQNLCQQWDYGQR